MALSSVAPKSSLPKACCAGSSGMPSVRVSPTHEARGRVGVDGAGRLPGSSGANEPHRRWGGDSLTALELRRFDEARAKISTCSFGLRRRVSESLREGACSDAGASLRFTASGDLSCLSFLALVQCNRFPLVLR